MKQIVFKLPEFPHLSETFIVNQIVMAVDMGYDVKILVNNIADYNPELLHPKINTYNLFNKIIIEDYQIPKNKIIRLLNWFRLLSLNILSFSKILKFYFLKKTFSLTWLYQWHFYYKLRNTSIFHVQYGTKSLVLADLKKVGYKPKLITTFHGHDAFFPLHGYIKNDGYYNNLFQNANIITANTKYLSDLVIGLGCPKNKLITIPVGVDVDFFIPLKSKQTNKDLKLITVGRLDIVKGHRYCIEVIDVLIKKGIQVSLTIIGDGCEYKMLSELILQKKLQKFVTLLGSKSQTEVRDLMQINDLYLLAAVALPDGRRESQGLATLEAQACGLPAIVFDSGGVKYTIDDNKSGFVCPEYSVDEMSEKILFLHHNRNVLQQMSCNAVQFVTDNFSQNVLYKKWGIIYKNICDEH